jgi:nickel/cobalt transporter (NicO) family protein
MVWKSRTFSCIVILIFSVRCASAHPLGDNSINQYLLLRIQPDGVHVSYRLDFAENLTAVELRSLDADHDGTVSDAERQAYLADHADEWASRITVSVNGKEHPAKVTSTDLKLTLTSPGRQTLLVMVDLVATMEKIPAGRTKITVVTGNYAGIPGWRECAALAAD